MKFSCISCLWLVSLALLLCFAGGCNVGGFAADALTPRIRNAQYVPPKTQTMLVLVENRTNPGMVVAEAEQLANVIITDLKDHEVCGITDPQKLQDLRDRLGTKVDKMSISDLGKALGANQVLYVNLVHLQLANTEGLPQSGEMELRVHVVDVKTNDTVWPLGSADFPLTFKTPLTVDVDSRKLEIIRNGLLCDAGTTVGRLFHDTNLDKEQE